MELALYNDNDKGEEFWYSKSREFVHEICASSLIKELDISPRTKVIYVMTAPEAPARQSQNVFDILNDDQVIHQGDRLTGGIRSWLRDQWRAGDRVAWIEY